MEYNRYTIYKEIIKNIETILKLNQSSPDFSNRKLYENKNIIDRFILECINHGISPHLSNNNSTKQESDIEDDKKYSKIESVFNKKKINEDDCGFID